MPPHNHGNFSVTAENIREISSVLRGGGVAVVPTETVYGLVGDAGNKKTLKRLQIIKNRPQGQAWQVLVPTLEAAQKLGNFNKTALILAKNFWPGPLTLVVPRLAGAATSPLASPDGKTLGLRVPNHPVIQQLLRESGCALTASSANVTGAPAPTDANALSAAIRHAVDAVLDGGACAHGVASTVVSPMDDGYKILRSGAISEERIRQALTELHS